MATCVNKSHPEFLELVEKSGIHPDILAAKIGVWMEKNDTDEFPALEDLNLNNYIRVRDNSPISQKLTNFLNKLNFTIEFREELKSESEFDAKSLTDLLYKTILIADNNIDKALAKETAYVAYSFLGKKNKIRTDLIHSIENLDNYKTIYNDYKSRSPQLNEYKIRELIITDYLADAIINNFENPKDSYINRKAEYWQIKGDSKLEKEIKYILSKIKHFINELFSNTKLTKDELNSLFDDLANDVLNNNFDKFGTILSNEQQLTNYENTINKDPIAKKL